MITKKQDVLVPACYLITIWETCDCMWSQSMLITLKDMIWIFLSTF